MSSDRGGSSMLAQLRNVLSADFSTLLSSRRQLIGLDIGSSAIKLVQLKEVKGRYVLQKCAVKPLEPEVIVDGTVMDEGRVVAAIRELMSEQGIKHKQAAISISGHAVIVKKISLPPMPDNELAEQVKLAAEQYIPFDINEVNLDFHVLNGTDGSGDGDGQMSILLVAAKKDKVNELCELVKTAGLTPSVMDVDAFAIQNMHEVNYPMTKGDVTTIVNIGASVMNVNIVQNGASLFTRDIPLGGNRYTEAIQRELGLSFEEAEEVKKSERPSSSQEEVVRSVMESLNAEVASEIGRTIDYYKSTAGDGDVERLLLCGGGAKASGLLEQLRDRMRVKVELANPFQEIDCTAADVDPATLDEMSAVAAVGVGLALRVMGD
ncbi:type IV pilus assembly protein PilM [Nitrospira tepida]|nr:type IV pilus assembly protein PilM [Nitrospira tepida]